MKTRVILSILYKYILSHFSILIKLFPLLPLLFKIDEIFDLGYRKIYNLKNLPMLLSHFLDKNLLCLLPFFINLFIY